MAALLPSFCLKTSTSLLFRSVPVLYQTFSNVFSLIVRMFYFYVLYSTYFCLFHPYLLSHFFSTNLNSVMNYSSWTFSDSKPSILEEMGKGFAVQSLELENCSQKVLYAIQDHFLNPSNQIWDTYKARRQAPVEVLCKYSPANVLRMLTGFFSSFANLESVLKARVLQNEAEEKVSTKLYSFIMLTWRHRRHSVKTPQFKGLQRVCACAT